MLHKLTVTGINNDIQTKCERTTKTIGIAWQLFAQLRFRCQHEIECNAQMMSNVQTTHNWNDLQDLNDLDGLKCYYEWRLLRKTVNAFTQLSTMTPNNNINEKKQKKSNMHMIHAQTKMAELQDHKNKKWTKMHNPNKQTTENHPASPKPAEL